MQSYDLKKYTWGELSYFKWKDLMLGELELLKRADQDKEVPKEIVDKIRASSIELAKSIPRFSTNFPSDKKPIKFKVLFEYISHYLDARAFITLAITDYPHIKLFVSETIKLLKTLC